MAKFSDAVRATLTGYFNAGDQPTEAQFTTLILAIQEGIEEHDHDGTGDGDGISDLVGLTSLGVGTDAPGELAEIRAPAAGNARLIITKTDDVPGQVIISLLHVDNSGGVLDLYDDAGISNVRIRGYGASFTLNSFGVGIDPTFQFDVLGNEAGTYLAKFFNDGGAGRHGVNIQCGADLNPTENFVRCSDGDGTDIGHIIGDGAGGVIYWSASDERLKDIIGPIDQGLAMRALVEVNPIQYTGKEANHKNVGFLAQDIRKYFPEVATYDEESDLYGMSYERLVPVLWVQNQALLARLEAGGL